MIFNSKEKKILTDQVKTALIEDQVMDDLTCRAIKIQNKSIAKVIFKESGILCGKHWVDEVFKIIDKKVKIKWHYKDGDHIKKGNKIATVTGNGVSILKGERVALNYLQTLSGISTIVKRYKDRLGNKKIKLLHTRKTVPGLRNAISYACEIMGCNAHRYDLSKSILIKENHLRLIKDLDNYLTKVKKFKKPIIMEARNLNDVKRANKYNLDRILLDNFTLTQIKKAIKITNKIPIEISGNINIKNIRKYAIPGVSYISIGALTKNIKAIDISLLLQ